MDVLLQNAQQLAAQALQPYLPIENRVAYMVSHGQSYTSNGYAIRTQGIAEALNGHGYDTLCFIRPGRPWELNTKIAPEVIVNGVRYIHSPWDNIAPADEISHLQQSVKRFVELFKVFRPSVVLAASNYIVSLPAYVAAKQLGLPFYNEVRGFWELSRDAREPGYANTLDFQLEASRDIFVANQALKVFTLNQPMKAELVKRGVAAEAIELVPNGVSQLPTIKPAKPELKARLGIADNDIVIGYVGSFNIYEGIETLIEACSFLVNQGLAIKLLLVGDGLSLNFKNDTNNQQSNFPWLIQTGRVVHSEVADYYALIDTVVIPRKKHAVCEIVPPMKIVEALTYGKRIIVSDISPLIDYKEKFEFLTIFNNNSVSSLAQAIQETLEQPVPQPVSSQLFSAHTVNISNALKYNVVSPNNLSLTSFLANKTANENNVTTQPIAVHNSIIKLTRDVYWHSFELNGCNVVSVLANVNIRQGNEKSGVLLVELYDKDNNKIKTDEINLPKSEVFDTSFLYLHDTIDKKTQLISFNTNKLIASVKLGFALFGTNDNTVINVSQLEVKIDKFSAELASLNDIKTTKKASEYKVAMIADEFTTNSFSGEFQVFQLEPDNWLDIFQKNQPDIFFCESAWAGPDSIKRSWRGKIYASINFPKENRQTLLSILEYCKKVGVPTVFWNKEDPTHYSDRKHDFVKTATLFDYVFTSAEECVEQYKQDYGLKNVFSLPFATNPRLFNPFETEVRNNKVVFAGSWYANHVERSTVMEQILDSLIVNGYKPEIYDRYYGDSDPLHIWPDKYLPYIKPGQPHDQMPAVYKSSELGLNFNTVTESSTMFARRVFELISSNTLVISNYSKGVAEMFGDLVVFADKDPERLGCLSESERNIIREQALQLVLTEHTYAKRWRYMLNCMGFKVRPDNEDITLVSRIASDSEVMVSISYFEQYFGRNSSCRLLLVVKAEVPDIDVAAYYQKYNRFGITVTSESFIQKHALEGKYQPVETPYFMLFSPASAPTASWLAKAKLHLSYQIQYPITPFLLKPYQLEAAFDGATLLAKTVLFIPLISELRINKTVLAYGV